MICKNVSTNYVNRPYRRTYRQFKDGSYTEGGRWQYVLHPKFARSPEHYVRSFLLLQKDIRDLFDYVEPADKNLGCYSYRIHSLLLRACVEVEANCKAILNENKYQEKRMNVYDYMKINVTHRLSSYEVKIPIWTGLQNIRHPFEPLATGDCLPWYQAYNDTKHNRHDKFEDATFEHLLDAVCGLLVILSAQFGTNDFSGIMSRVIVGYGPNDGMELGIGGYFRVKFPDDWPEEMKYDFDWQAIKNEEDPFQEFDYSCLKISKKIKG